MMAKQIKIFRFLEKKPTLFFVIAVITRAAYFFYFPPLGTDQIMIHTAVDNLIQGHGLSFPIANLQDLSIVQFQPMNEWPPLTGYLIYAVKVFIADARATDLVLMTVGILLLLFAIRQIMKSIEIKPLFQSAVWILIATNPEPFYMAGVSDIYSCSCMLWGVFFCISFVRSAEIKIQHLVFASIIFFLAAAFRYQYYAVIFICPVFLMLAGSILKQTDLIKKGGVSFLIVLILLVIQISVLYFQTGAAARIADDKIGIYFENLAHMYPFLIKGFLNTSYFENILVLKNEFSIVILHNLFLLVTAVLLIAVARYIYFQYKKATVTANEEHKKLYLGKGLLFFVSLGVILFLSTLSFIYRPQVSSGGMFTYIKENRYFLVPSFLLLLLSISILQQSIASFNSNQKKLFTAVSIFVFTVNILLFAKFGYNVISERQKIYRTGWTVERKNVFDEIEKQKQKNKMPVVAVGNNYFSYQPMQENFGIIKKLKHLKETGIKTSKPVQLLIITQLVPDTEEQKFIIENRAELIYTGTKCRVYHLLING